MNFLASMSLKPDGTLIHFLDIAVSINILTPMQNEGYVQSAPLSDFSRTGEEDIWSIE